MLWELGISLKMEPTSWQPVLPFGSFFLDFGPDPDFAPDPDFFQEIGPVIALELPYLNYFTQNASYELLYSHYFFKTTLPCLPHLQYFIFQIYQDLSFPKVTNSIG